MTEKRDPTSTSRRASQTLRSRFQFDSVLVEMSRWHPTFVVSQFTSARRGVTAFVTITKSPVTWTAHAITLGNCISVLYMFVRMHDTYVAKAVQYIIRITQ
jgi:hypothetical protein